jgi:hypothetical protein
MFSISHRTAAYVCWSLALLGVLVIVATWFFGRRTAAVDPRDIDSGSYILGAAVMFLGPGSLLPTLTGEAYWQKWRVRGLFAVLSTAYVTILFALAIMNVFG